MISNVISYTVAARLHPVPIYDALLRQDGVPMPDHETHHDLRGMTVEQAMRTDVPVAHLDDSPGPCGDEVGAGSCRRHALARGYFHRHRPIPILNWILVRDCDARPSLLRSSDSPHRIQR